jgi:hypothetical protein
LRQAWGRHRANRQLGCACHHPHDVEHPLRTHDAVAPDGVHIEGLNLLGEAFGQPVHQRLAVLHEAFGGDNRHIGREATRDANRQREFLRVDEGLQNQPVHPAVQQGADLLFKRLLGFGEAHFAHRLQRLADGTDRAEHQRVVADRRTRQLRRRAVDALHQRIG